MAEARRAAGELKMVSVRSGSKISFTLWGVVSFFVRGFVRRNFHGKERRMNGRGGE
jgi:hypothetical protein